MTIENLGISIDKTFPAFQKESASDNFANRRGMEVQHNLCKLLGGLDYVLWIRETIKDSFEDKNKKDLIIGLDQSKKDLVIPDVSVQVKASTTGESTFKRDITRMLRRQGKTNITREQWLLENRIIVLVGDLHISKSHKNRWLVTEEQTLASFEYQLAKINDYARSRR